jgi:hypothetical protein
MSEEGTPTTPPPDPLDRHPEDVELFSLVEGDPVDPGVAEHVARCAQCAETVRQLETGKAALRAAPLLHLPPRRRESVLGGLPKREPWRPKRLLAVLAPVAALAAVVGVLATSVGGNGGGAEEAAAPAAEDEAAGGEAAPAATAPQLESDAPPFASVQGPPARVVEVLREAGLEARVVDGTVEVRGASERELRLALAALALGDVPVHLRDPAP